MDCDERFVLAPTLFPGRNDARKARPSSYAAYYPMGFSAPAAALQHGPIVSAPLRTFGDNGHGYEGHMAPPLQGYWDRDMVVTRQV